MKRLLFSLMALVVLTASATAKVKKSAPVVGDKFIEITGTTPDGKDSKLSDFVGQGKWVLADFWASWCGPCRAAIPHLAEIDKELSGTDFAVLGVNVADRDSTKRIEAIKVLNMTWPVLVTTGQSAITSYGIQGIPAFFLFRPDGTIAVANVHSITLKEIKDEMNKK